MLTKMLASSFWIIIIVFARLLIECSNNEEYICNGDIDIRNWPVEFIQLEKCTVVHGFIQIALIESSKSDNYSSLSFPALKEVTCFILIYHVSGLKTLRHLFPNLAVIRGQELFYNFALIVYDMSNLEEIGLASLTTILRGSVYIERNPKLCYANKIDWDLIAKNGKGDHYIKNNKVADQCAQVCPQKCPLRKNSEKIGDSLCWNKHYCQKVCDSKCGDNFCTEYSSCCSDQCLGGCVKPDDDSSCLACKNVRYENTCLSRCPPFTLKLDEIWCETERECRSHDVHESATHEDSNGNTKFSWKIFNDQCIAVCPPHYEQDKRDKHKCTKCVHSCPKYCNGLVVNSTESSQMLRGCTHIRGSLQIRTGFSVNMEKELEKNLNTIEEVSDFVEVTLSVYLKSIEFLKNLRIIRGANKQNKYTLLIYDNPNLVQLMNVNTTRKLHIMSGKMFIHLNPKLCVHKIKQFVKLVSSLDWENNDISLTSNGHKTTCNVETIWINILVINVTTSSALIEWENVQHQSDDKANILRYTISYKKTLFKNVTTYDHSSNCSGNRWTMTDIVATNSAQLETRVQFVISALDPFAQYSVFVRAVYDTNTEMKYAQSEIIYFVTSADVPSMPRKVGVVSIRANQFLLLWSPPIKPNGHVTNYKITGKLIDDSTIMNNNRDYCKYPVVQRKETRNAIIDLRSEEKNADKCTGEMKNFAKTDQEEFENLIHDLAYSEKFESLVDVNEPDLDVAFQETTSSSKKVIKNLIHFSRYMVEVKACHDPDSRGKMLCSLGAIVIAQTAAIDNEVKVEDVQLTKLNASDVQLRWNESQYTNGFIVAYQVEYYKISKHQSVISKCISYQSFRQERGSTLIGLASGNYKLRLRTNSLAGFGKWTKYVEFFIESPGVYGETPESFVSVAVTFIVFAIIFSTLVLFWIFQKIREKSVFSKTERYIADEWEIPRQKIRILKELGQGSFGMVYFGLGKSIIKGQAETKCAIKTVNERASTKERIEFLNEASVMKAFSCCHVIKLLGVVSKGQPTLVVMEHMSNGDLKAYLRSFHPQFKKDQCRVLSLKCVLRMASEIADGMAYLSAKKFVHRDLAARNCMVGEDLVVKIGDFGMTRNTYQDDYYRASGKRLLPIRWMAPESINDGIFSTLSDVWSFGIVLWEMATLAAQPYQGFSHQQVVKYVGGGGVMERPINCPRKLYALMKTCWHQNPKHRPSFVELVKDLLPYVRLNFHKNSFYFSQEAQRLASQINIINKHSLM